MCHALAHDCTAIDKLIVQVICKYSKFRGYAAFVDQTFNALFNVVCGDVASVPRSSRYPDVAIFIQQSFMRPSRYRILVQPVAEIQYVESECPSLVEVSEQEKPIPESIVVLCVV